jgi:hypothetical protein
MPKLNSDDCVKFIIKTLRSKNAVSKGILGCYEPGDPTTNLFIDKFWKREYKYIAKSDADIANHDGGFGSIDDICSLNDSYKPTIVFGKVKYPFVIRAFFGATWKNSVERDKQDSPILVNAYVISDYDDENILAISMKADCC